MSCKGSLTTDTHIQRAVYSVSHNNNSNQDTVTATYIVASMKDTPVTNRAKHSQLLADFTKDATTEVRPAMGYSDLVRLDVIRR